MKSCMAEVAAIMEGAPLIIPEVTLVRYSLPWRLIDKRFCLPFVIPIYVDVYGSSVPGITCKYLQGVLRHYPFFQSLQIPLF